MTELSRAAHALAERATGWLHRHRSRGTLGDVVDPDLAYKPLGESAMAATLVLREGVAGPAGMQAARELLAHAWDEFRDGDLLWERQLPHPTLTDPLEVYGHFARAGLRHERLDALLAHLGSLASVRCAEQLPNRRLAVANAARLAGVDHDVDWDALTSATWLGGTPEPWALDWMTAYSMTHTVFHVTDWGARPGALPRRLQDYLHTWLPVWLEVWREIGEWDLVGELLIVDACLEQPAATAHDYTALAAVQRDDGLLPCDGAPVDDDPERAFQDHHHPTVVACVAGTLALSRSLG